MKEQRIIVEIDHSGKITADSSGFSGDACIDELERLLEGLAPGVAVVKRKPDAGDSRVATTRTQSLGRKP